MRSIFDIASNSLFCIRLIIAVAIAVAPLTMSHASVGSESEFIQKHTSFVEKKDHDHNIVLAALGSDVKSIHHNHDRQDCCSGICGGALTVELGGQHFCPSISRRVLFVDQALEPGEWVLPFRPPSI